MFDIYGVGWDAAGRGRARGGGGAGAGRLRGPGDVIRRPGGGCIDRAVARQRAGWRAGARRRRFCSIPLGETVLM